MLNLSALQILQCSTMCVVSICSGASKQLGSFQVLRHCHPCALNPLQLHVGLPYLLQRSRSSGNHNLHAYFKFRQLPNDLRLQLTIKSIQMEMELFYTFLYAVSIIILLVFITPSILSQIQVKHLISRNNSMC